MSVTRKFTIWSPAAKLAGTPDLVISRSAQELVTYEDLGQLRYEELTETGILTLQENAAEARLYTFQMADSIEKTALLNYLRTLQKRGDSSASIGIQKGELRFRDEWWRFDTAEITNINFRTATGTPITVATRSLTYYEAPCYLLMDGPWRSRLGASTTATEETSGEGADFAILERINPIDSDGITAQLSGTIRIAYSTEFQVDFTILSNPYIRGPSKSVNIDYSLRESPGITGVRLGTYKQEWSIQGAELTLTELKELRSLLSRWRDQGGNITLTDLTSEISEPTPRTRAIATGVEDISNGQTRYFGSFNVGQHEKLSVSPKSGDNTKVLVDITFRELGASA